MKKVSKKYYLNYYKIIDYSILYNYLIYIILIIVSTITIINGRIPN